MHFDSMASPMATSPLDAAMAERHRTLFLLDARIAAARAELTRLDGQAVDVERRGVSRHERRLMLVNQRLSQAVTVAREQQAKAEDAHRRQAKSLAMVAHELRGPLNPIRMATDLLRHAQADEGQLVQVRGILDRQVGHLARLVDDLVDGVRVDAGRFRLERLRVPLREILDPVVDTMRPAIAQRQQTLVTSLSTDAIAVDADPMRLAQVFGNLLDNASKYTPRGGTIDVDLSCDGGVATVRIRDDGIGISAEALPRIFDLFVQEPHAQAHDRRGLGLGLTIVRELVEAHGGTIVAASAGHALGSEFVVTLPGDSAGQAGLSSA